jgi:hypothetical protein
MIALGTLLWAARNVVLIAVACALLAWLVRVRRRVLERRWVERHGYWWH